MGTLPTFTDDFSNFPANWSGHPNAIAQGNVLSFAPERYASQHLVTTRTDFADVRMEADIRIVSGAAAFIPRYRSAEEYYMVQFDIAAEKVDRNKAWFHCFSPKYESSYGMKRDVVTSARVPALGQWHRMSVEIVNHQITLSLGDDQHSFVECARWTDTDRLFDSGAIGFWECPGEHAEYRNLKVTELDS